MNVLKFKGENYDELEVYYWELEDIVCFEMYDGDIGISIDFNRVQAKTLGEALINWGNGNDFLPDILRRKFEL